MTEENRRSTDRIVMEMHGMLQRLDQKMDDTQKWFKSAHEAHLESDRGNFKALNDRLEPIDDAFKFIKVLRWPAGVVITPVLVWAGYALVERLKH